MTSRQRTLNRSGTLEARSTQCRATPARAAGKSTTMADRPAKELADKEDFVFDCEVFDIGAGAGADLRAEHWQEPPREPEPFFPQQQDPLVLQQRPRRPEFAAARLQGRLCCAELLQRGHPW
jgi:hypothetical protein